MASCDITCAELVVLPHLQEVVVSLPHLYSFCRSKLGGVFTEMIVTAYTCRWVLLLHFMVGCVVINDTFCAIILPLSDMKCLPNVVKLVNILLAHCIATPII